MAIQPLQVAVSHVQNTPFNYLRTGIILRAALTVVSFIIKVLREHIATIIKTGSSQPYRVPHKMLSKSLPKKYVTFLCKKFTQIIPKRLEFYFSWSIFEVET